MAISNEQRLTLYKLAREHWIEAHTTLSAYERGYHKNKLLSDWVQRGTLALAVCTALSTSTRLQFLIVSCGLLTAVLAAIDQAFAPSKSLQALWNCRTQLDWIKKDIVSCVISLESVTDLASGMKPLDQIATRLREEAKIPYDILPSDREAALSAIRESVLTGMMSRYEQVRDEDFEKPVLLGSDAPDIVAVGRQFRRSTRG